MTPRIYTINEAAAALGVSRPTVYRLIADGELVARRYPRVRGRRIADTDLREYIERGQPIYAT